jgi:heavy metal sensor kinase
VNLRFSSVRVRLTLWYSLILGLIIFVFSLAVFFFVRGRFLVQLNGELESDFLEISQATAEEPNELPDFETEGPAEFFAIARDGKLLAATPAFKKSGLPVFVRLQESGTRRLRSPSGARFRLKTAPAGAGLLLTVAVEEEPMWSALRTLSVILVLALPAALILAAFGGYVMAGRLLKPVAVLTARAERISAENLSARLPVGNHGDEFGQLASVFNRTLARLEDSFERLKRFTADASHELRTPLTVIRSVGEVALEEDLDASAYRDRIGSMLEEVDRLAFLVDDLLTLTRADSGPIPLARKDTDAGLLVRQAVEDMTALAEEKGQRLTLDLGGPAVLEIDGATVRLALVNLLDNAVKYTPPSGTITVSSRIRGGELLIEVSDTGPGIPAEHRSRVFDRFYRVEKDRSGRPGGAGLGLSIAKWAAEANGGRIELVSGEGRGCTFRLVFPLARRRVQSNHS